VVCFPVDSSGFHSGGGSRKGPGEGQSGGWTRKRRAQSGAPNVAAVTDAEHLVAIRQRPIIPRLVRHPMTVESAGSEARRALNRLRRSVEKSARDLKSLESAIRHAEGEDFPSREYEEVRGRLDAVLDFLEEEGRRLEEKILQRGGLEPGRVRRSSG
jgi:hypothetical protein